MRLGSQLKFLGLGWQCFGLTVLLHFVLASSAYKNGVPSEGVLGEPEKTLAYQSQLIDTSRLKSEA